jgi:hypothetical protein
MFTWCPADMLGIPRELVEHELKIFPSAKPIKQSMHRYNPEKARSMGEEINCLLEAKFIREIKEATWLSLLVMVEKKDTKFYRMCIDFTALNKHFPKDYFPLPRIDQIIDSTAGCERLSFLDAYSRYNQIRLKVEDEDKTAFITLHGVYCYTTMTFGLKNVGATYQRCMQACLKEQIGRNVEVYVDDVIIKSTNADSLLDNLRETFANLDRYSIKLNLKKMLLRSTYNPAIGLPHLQERNQRQPEEDPSHNQHAAAKDTSTCPAVDRSSSGAQSLHKQARRKGSSLLSTSQKNR